MGKDNGTVVGVGSVLLGIDNLLVVGVDLLRGDGPGSSQSFPIGLKDYQDLVSFFKPRERTHSVVTPDNVGHVHPLGNDSDSVVDIPERRPPALGGDAKDILDELSGVV